MCEQTDVDYLDGEVVWVKLGSCWWPGQVVAPDKLPPDVLPSFRKPPIAVVKFFQEDTYEYVKNSNLIFKYNCSRKNEFINKGLYMFRTKHGHMEKFPDDVIRAETAVGGDVEILTRDEFQEKKKESYAGLFGDSSKKTPGSIKKGKGGKGRPSVDSPRMTPFRKIKEKVDYKVHILVQGSKGTPAPATENPPSETEATPSTSAEQGSDIKAEEQPQLDNEEKPKPENIEKPPAAPSTPASSSSGMYACHACPFTTTRLNVLILHNKTHSVSFTPYTPSPVRKKVLPKSSKSTPNTSKTRKVPREGRPRKEKSEKDTKNSKKSQSSKKRAADEEADVVMKKMKTDEEIKSSLLADWDDGDDESNDESSTMIMAGSPEVPEAAESPAVPTSAELSSLQMPSEVPSPTDKKSSSPASEKPECSSDSKYEFCEDEDWPLEADGGRKIPRVKNPKRKEDTKSLSLDDDEVAREVAELLNKTTVPELPSAPEPLKVEENFPEPSIVKSPDKCDKTPENSEKPAEAQPTKAIFKTKTFFRSRHSRSQDAIGKYVAEQLNAVERMDISESDINGGEAVSSPEARESPPIEHVKVARLAPKIQLKKMKAEAAQFREKFNEAHDFNQFADLMALNTAQTESALTLKENEDKPLETKQLIDNTLQDSVLREKPLLDVLYPTQEIKPVNTDVVEHIKSKVSKVESKEDVAIKEIGTVVDNGAYMPKTESSFKEITTILDGASHTSKIEISIKDVGIVVDDATHTLTVETSIKDIGTMVDNVTRTSTIETSIKDIGTVEDDVARKSTIETSIIDIGTVVDEVAHPSTIETSIKDIGTVVDGVAHTSIIETSIKDIGTVVDDVAHTSTIETSQSPDNDAELSTPIAKFPKTSLQKAYEQSMEPYMNESTASAVDALLSVSREADRVTRIISDDPPEDLFEDDIKDNGSCNNINGYDETANGEHTEIVVNEPEAVESNNELKNNFDEFTINEKSKESVSENKLVEESVISTEGEETIDSVPKNIDNVPSESDLQIAETLINLPSTAIQSKPSNEQQLELLTSIAHESIQEEVIHSTESMILDDKSQEPIEEQASPTQSKSLLISNNEPLNVRFETEQEKSENLNAAQSLVQMSESIDHKINLDHNLNNSVKSKELSEASVLNVKSNNGLGGVNSVEQNVAMLSNDNNSETTGTKSIKIDTSSSKLLKILEEPCIPKVAVHKPTPTKQIVLSGKEKILNFDVAKSSFKSKPDSPKQKIIIRRTAPTKNIINNMGDIGASEKIILSRSNNSASDGSVQTYTIQTSPETPSDANTIIIQQKIRKVAKPPCKLQKIKPHNSLVTPITESKVINQTACDEALFDINSMPIVISDDVLTPESIEKMPMVMADGNIITPTTNPPKLVKTKQPVETEKVAISATPNKPEVKTLLMNPVSEVSNLKTPNILSKSSKLRGAKPMLVIDKATGKQKIIMTKGESTVKDVKPAPTLLQTVPQNTGKAEKFIILPTASHTAPRPGRTQKIVIDPQTGKAHVLVSKGPEPQMGGTDNKPVSAKLIPPSTDASAPGNTVMIITNAQGAQSRIVLTPEHEKMLFPKKQQTNVSQLKTVAHRLSTNSGVVQKTLVTSAPPKVQNVVAPKTQNIVSAKTQNVVTAKTQNVIVTKGQNVATAKSQALPKTQNLVLTKTQNVTSAKSPARIVPKQKSAIITSKGQLIVGGRVATTAQNIAPMPEIRPVPKRIMASEPKKLIQTIQKSTSETLIFLQQKSGAVMQLTAAQFEHLQRTGQIVQKTVTPAENKVIQMQKSITISPNESVSTTMHKQRVRKTVMESPTPVKRLKQEVAIAPAPAPASPLPPLTPFTQTTPLVVPSVANTVSVSTTSAYPEFENFEELLPSTAIVRQQEPVAPPPPPPPLVPPPPPPVVQPEPAAAPTQLSDGQLLAVPGEHFGGPPGSFYLCVEDSGTLTPIDNRPLVLENNQLVPMAVEPLPVLATQPERRDILEAALANSDVFHADTTRDEGLDFRDLNANVSVHCRVSETSTTLNQPIMTPVEVPTKADSEPAVPASIEDGLAVIGVTPHTVPTSLELPITVTDPRIAPKTTDPLSGHNYGTTLLPSPSTEMYVSTEETEIPMGGPISMPLLTDDDSVGKSMPILTDEVAERTVSSVESMGESVESPSSAEESGGGGGGGGGGQWTRRLHTPGSDTSDASAEIPLQPVIQLSVNELSRHS